MASGKESSMARGTMIPVRPIQKWLGVKRTGENYSGLDLSGHNLSNSLFISCNFDRTDMTDVIAENSVFQGCSFRDTICYRTSFKNSKLAGSVFEPSDAYGMTITLTCETMRGVQISQMWFYSWLMFATQMEPAAGPVLEDIKAGLIAMIGAARYAKLSALFQRREM
jgi:hypothetical protein